MVFRHAFPDNAIRPDHPLSPVRCRLLRLDDGVPADKAKKPLFTSGKGNKRTFGVTTWNSEGTKYFEEAMTNWMGA